MDESQLVERLQARGYSVKLGPGLPGGNDRFVAVVWRDGSSRGYFGPTELDALRKAWERTAGDSVSSS
jgi:hypothetical protein